MKVVGQDLPRVEILEKVTGQSIFGADARPIGAFLFGKVLRSPHGHARIKKIDTKAAERLRGGQGSGYFRGPAQGSLWQVH